MICLEHFDEIKCKTSYYKLRQTYLVFLYGNIHMQEICFWTFFFSFLSANVPREISSIVHNCQFHFSSCRPTTVFKRITSFLVCTVVELEMRIKFVICKLSTLLATILPIIPCISVGNRYLCKLWLWPNNQPAWKISDKKKDEYVAAKLNRQEDLKIEMSTFY